MKANGIIMIIIVSTQKTILMHAPCEKNHTMLKAGRSPGSIRLNLLCLLMRKPGPRKQKWFVQGHRGHQWESWEENPGLRGPGCCSEIPQPCNGSSPFSGLTLVFSFTISSWDTNSWNFEGDFYEKATEWGLKWGHLEDLSCIVNYRGGTDFAQWD